MMNEAEKYLLEILKCNDLRKDIIELIREIQEPRKIKLIYAYVKAMNKINMGC